MDRVKELVLHLLVKVFGMDARVALDVVEVTPYLLHLGRRRWR